MTIYLSLLVSLVGLLLMAFAPPPAPPSTKLGWIGWGLFACGLLAFLLLWGGADVVALPARHR